MNWLLALGPKFLASKISGYLALGALSALLGFGWYVSSLRDKVDRLERECLASISPEVEQIAQDLKDANAKEFDKLREALDRAEHPCLDWEYNPEDWL